MLSLFLCLLFSSMIFPPKAGSLENSSPLNRYSLWSQSPAPAPLPSPWGHEILPASHPPSAKNDSKNSAIFIRLKLNMKTKENLKDSLIDLGSETGFRPDARFDPVVDGQSKKAFIWGWMPLSKISQVTKLPAVEKISFSDHGRKRIPMDAKETLIVGLEVDSSISKTLSEDLPRLLETTGLKIQKTIGYQPIPQSDKIAVLFLGQIPISNINRLLNQTHVVKVLPLMSKSGNVFPSNAKKSFPNADFAADKLMFFGGALGLLLGCFSFYLLFSTKKEISF